MARNKILWQSAGADKSAMGAHCLSPGQDCSAPTRLRRDASLPLIILFMSIIGPWSRIIRQRPSLRLDQKASTTVMSRDNSRTHNPWEEPPRETSYEAFLRLKRLKQRARQSRSSNSSSESPETNARSGPETRHPAASKGTNTTSPRQRPPQQRQHPLPSELPLDENSETDIPSRRYRSPSHASEMYTEDFHNGDMYETDAPMAPPPPSPPRATARVRPSHTRDSDDMYGRDDHVLDKSALYRSPSKQRARPRKRGFGSVVLIGCIGALVALGLIVSIVIIAFLRTPLGGNILSGITSKTYTQQSSQTLSVSGLKLAQINDQ